MNTSVLLVALLAALPSEDPFLIARDTASSIDSPAPAGAIPLEACLREALEKNPDIRRDTALLDQALGQKTVYRSRALPRLNLTVPGGRKGRKGTESAENFIILTGQLTQPLFDAAIPASSRRGSLGELAARQQLFVTATDRLHAVRLAYLEALYHRAQTRLLLRQQELLQSNIKAENDRREAGISPRSAVMQAQIQSYQIEPRIEESRRQERLARVTLARILGRDLHQDQFLPEPQGPLPFEPALGDLPALFETTLAQRPDFRLLETLIRAADADKRIAEAGYFPLIQLVGTTQYLPSEELSNNQNAIRASDNVSTSEAALGVQFSWRVFDPGTTLGASRRIRAESEISALTLQTLKESAARELSTTLRALRAAQERIVAQAASLQLAEETIRLVESAQRGGTAGQIEFLEAQSSLLEARTGVLNAVYTHNLALAELDRITGRYLSYVETPR